LAEFKQAILRSFQIGLMYLPIDRQHLTEENYQIRINGIQHPLLTQNSATIMIAISTKLPLNLLSAQVGTRRKL